MAVKKKRLLTVIALLVVASNVEQSVQLKSNHPLHSVVDRINQNGGPYIGMLMAYSTEESALLDSGLFFPSSDLPSVDFSGRRFNIGKIRGVDVIYVMTGQQTLNAGITVQMLVGAFDVKGIVFYGTAGSANDSLNIGDVSVPKYVAYTASWKWKEFRSEKGGLAELEFGAYNFPTKGDNLFAKVEFTPQEVYSNGQPMEELFWLEVEPKWFVLASQLQVYRSDLGIICTCLSAPMEEFLSSYIYFDWSTNEYAYPFEEIIFYSYLFNRTPTKGYVF